jgi:hypothetical protein
MVNYNSNEIIITILQILICIVRYVQCRSAISNIYDENNYDSEESCPYVAQRPRRDMPLRRHVKFITTYNPITNDLTTIT